MDFKNDKRGIFGLTSVQQFFVVILGIALLAYVIVIIMGTLGGSTILPPVTDTVTNESVVMGASKALSYNTYSGCSASITQIINGSSYLIGAANYSVTGCVISNTTNSTILYGSTWLVSYTANHNTLSKDRLDSVLTNTSSGITSFFSSINPVYAILAVLVIILVLVVLVRVVQGGKPSESGGAEL